VSDRLRAVFERRKPAFIPYAMAGDPDLATAEAIVAALGRAGADIVELGIPYGDPLADGPTIAAAAQRALAQGVTMRDVLSLAKRAHDAGAPPIVLFTYFNPVDRYGIDAFARDAAQAGAAGVIVPDVPLEEIDMLWGALEKHDLAMPLLVAPTTPRERAARIAERATGFVYVVSRLGVTGAGESPDVEPLRTQLGMLRTVTDKPLAIGFGISRPEHVRAVAPLCDGIIVGSALIDAYAGTAGKDAAARVARLAGELVAAARH
jgi:tryptophan synthase alpha chain